MKKYLPTFLIISIVLGVVMYLATDNMLLSVAIFGIAIVFSIAMIVPKLTRFYVVIDRYHECYHFINNFIISLSIKNSISAALENTQLSMGKDFHELYIRMENMTEKDKVIYLESYFPFYSYKLFLQIIALWEEEGGDVLMMSNYLLTEIRYEEDYVTTITSLARRKYIESVSLWMICIAILILLRFTLNDFYTKIKVLPIFLIALFVFMLFLLFSVYLLVDRATKIELKGYNKHEKIL